MQPQITIVDYGMGNLHSVRRKLERVGARTIVTSSPQAIAAADKLVLPGVGHFQRAMENLRELRLVDALNEARARQVPILGICLGMQLMARRSEEGGVDGLAWVDADVVRFKVTDTVRHKVPHMGWNRVAIQRESALLRDLPPDGEFYFVHSYHMVCDADADRIVLCRTDYAYPFTSAIQQDNVLGVQFHPEKSHAAGERVLANFMGI